MAAEDDSKGWEGLIAFEESARRERGFGAGLPGDRKCVRLTKDLNVLGMPMGVAFLIRGGGFDTTGVN